MSYSKELYDSCEHVDYGRVEFFLKRGAIADNMAMKIMSKIGDIELAKLLIQFGGIVTLDCLSIAANYNRVELIIFYKSIGVVDTYGEAYEIALRGGFRRCAELLFAGKMASD